VHSTLCERAHVISNPVIMNIQIHAGETIKHEEVTRGGCSRASARVHVLLQRPALSRYSGTRCRCVHVRAVRAAGLAGLAGLTRAAAAAAVHVHRAAEHEAGHEGEGCRGSPGPRTEKKHTHTQARTHTYTHAHTHTLSHRRSEPDHRPTADRPAAASGELG